MALLEKIIFGVGASIFGGVLNRIHGGMWNVPRWLTTMLWTAGFMIDSLLTGQNSAAAIGGLASAAGISTGHGNGQSEGRVPHGDKPEKVELLISWLRPHISAEAYDDLILTLCALLMASGGIIGHLSQGNWIGGVIVAYGALLSPIAYGIGWAVYPHEQGKGIRNFNQATQLGEFFTGAFIYGALTISVLI